jgi:hypothetical protein
MKDPAVLRTNMLPVPQKPGFAEHLAMKRVLLKASVTFVAGLKTMSRIHIIQ